MSAERQSQPGPIERFLGPEEASGGPFALLGVEVRDLTDREVLDALERQLERVSRHREGNTPAADEVRLALHAAGAQLLDPHVRRRLVVRWGGSLDARPAAAAAPRGVARTNRPLEQDAILTLGMFGGWNRRSLRRLLSLAHARGIPNHEVAATLSRIAGRRARWTPAAGPGPGARRPVRRVTARQDGSRAEGARDAAAREAAAREDAEALAEQQDPMVGLLKMAALVVSLVVVLAGLSGAVIWLALTMGEPGAEGGGGPGAPAPTGEVASEGAGPTVFDRPKEAPTTVAAPSVEESPKDEDLALGEVVLALRGALDGLQIDAREATDEFVRAVEALSVGWLRMARDDRIAARQRVVEFVYRVSSSSELSREAIEAVAAGAAALDGSEPDTDGVARGAWSVGMLARLSRERDLSAMVEGIVRRRLGDALGHTGGASMTTFEGGARAALGVSATALARAGGSEDRARLDAWARWLACVDAVTEGDDAAREQLILGAIETVLTRGPEPTDDKATFDAIGLLVSRVAWAADAEARTWLVRWFADRRVSNGDLHAVTMALVTRTRAPGVTQLMTLSPAASDRVRMQLRDQFVVAWGLGESVRLEGLVVDWANAARSALSRAAPDPSGALEQAVRLSRLSEVASLLWRGHSAEAAALLEALEAPLDQLRASAAPSGGAGAPGTDVGDGRWALRYLEADRNIPIRLSLLEQVGTGTLGPVDAEVLVRDAMRGSPLEVREKARAVAIEHADDATVVNAVLEELPRARRDSDSAEFIAQMAFSSLPPVKSPSWPHEARRAVVERLLQLTAAETEYAWVDALSARLAASYEDRASVQPIPDEVPLSRTPPEASESAGRLWYLLLDEAQRARAGAGAASTLDDLARRRNGRLSLADGLVQRFAAEQASLCELAAALVGIEHSEARDRVELILAELSDRRRRARHIFEQIEAGERAMLRLWLVRLAEGTG